MVFAYSSLIELRALLDNFIVQRFDISPFFRCILLWEQMKSGFLFLCAQGSIDGGPFENRQAIDARLICSSDWTPGVSNTILKFSFSENISFLPLWGDVGVRRPTQHPAITLVCDGFIFRWRKYWLSLNVLIWKNTGLSAELIPWAMRLAAWFLYIIKYV